MTLLLAHLADDDPGGPHPQRLLDQPAQPDLTGPFQVGLPGLHRHHVGQRDLQLENLFASDDALRSRDGRRQRVQERRLPGLRSTGHQDVEPGDHRRLEESGTLPGQRAEGNELVEGVRGQHELADVQRPVPPGDIRDHHVQPGPVGKHGVDEGLRYIHPSTRGLQHLLDQVADLRVGEDRGGQLAAAGPGHEDPSRFVDPDLLHGRIVEERLEWPEPGHGVVNHPGDPTWVGEHRQVGAEAPLVVVGHDLVHQTADGRRVGGRVEATAAHQLADFVLDDSHAVHWPPQRGRYPTRPGSRWSVTLDHRAARTQGRRLTDCGRPGTAGTPVHVCAFSGPDSD
ncbi:MAG TPA: hypothetical protein VNG13_12550 [Mycobacteriales bacterium]|nr:hypothetical protein [Mycobacteriales bacterium]